MCGFSCYFNFNSDGVVCPDIDLDASLESIRHRGPESTGKYISPCGRCALGHVRLSIIDIAGGQQPLSNKSGNTNIVVNGEIYDFERIRDELEVQGYEFKTKSDSEVILHLYEENGLSMFDELRGEFAFCIFDKRKNRFIAARDRFGIKPLYYTVVNNTLLCASEIKAFISMGWKPEWDIDSVVNNGSLLDFRTCFKGVYKLPPAHYLIANSSGLLNVQRYWDSEYPDKNVKEARTEEEMIDGVRERLVESVRLRLIADVPVGVYLSGGIDSSCIAGIATELLKKENPNAKIKAFTISFADDKRYDESDFAERTAKHCGADFEKLIITEDILLNNFEDCVWHVELPQLNLNSVGKFMLSKLVNEQGYKVVLTGEGSDEHFGGYDFFHNDYLLEADHASLKGTFSEEDRKKKLNTPSTNMFTQFNHSGVKSVNQPADPLSKAVENLFTHKSISTTMSLQGDYYTNDVIATVGAATPIITVSEGISAVARTKAKNVWHPLHTALYVESHTLLPNYLCNHLGDRCEMAHSVEGRTPFLDHHFCEYVNSLPPSVKLRAEENGSLNEKWVLKQAVKPYITEEMYNRTKHPFLAPTPIITEINRENTKLNTLIEEHLNLESISKLGWLNFEKVEMVKERFIKNGSPSDFKELLMIMSYVILSKRFNIATFGTSSEVIAR